MIITIFTSLVTLHAVEILIKIACNESDSGNHSILKGVLELNRYFLHEKNHLFFIKRENDIKIRLWKSIALLVSFPNCSRLQFLAQYVTVGTLRRKVSDIKSYTKLVRVKTTFKSAMLI